MTPIQKVKQIILLIFGLSVAHLGVTFLFRQTWVQTLLMFWCREFSEAFHGRMRFTGPTDAPI